MMRDGAQERFKHTVKAMLYNDRRRQGIADEEALALLGLFSDCQARMSLVRPSNSMPKPSI